MVENNNTENQTQPSSDALAKPTQPSSEVSPQLAFIEKVIRKIPPERFQASYRLTSKGLFYDQASQDEILQLYRQYEQERTGREVDLADQKILKRWFGSETPVRVYLPEGKRCLTGFIIPCSINNPANYRLPYYLGTPQIATSYLHPGDPVFQKLSGVTTRLERDGLEISFPIRNHQYTITIEGLQRFAKLAANTPRVWKRFPAFRDSLAETFRIMYLFSRKSRLVKPEDEPLRPLRFADPRNDNVEVRTAFGFYFIFDRNHRLQFIYQVRGKNLYDLIRDEIAYPLAKAEHGHYGSLEIFKRQHKLIGTFSAHGKKITLHGNALTRFIDEQLSTPHLRKKGKGFPTIKSYLENFILTFQLSQPITRSLISTYLTPQQQHHYSYFVNQLWLFLVSSQNCLDNCLTKTSRHRRQRR